MNNINASSPLLIRTYTTSFNNRKAIYYLLKNWLPLLFSSLLQSSLFIINVVFLGQVSSEALAASGLCSFISMCTGIAPIIGLLAAQDTLCSQAYTAANNKNFCGIVLQRTITIILTVMFPIVLLWNNIEPFLLFVNQQPQTVRIAQIFLRYFSVVIPLFMVGEAIKKYLQAQGIMKAGLYTSLITTPIHFILSATLTFSKYFDMGYHGVMTSFLITTIVNLVLLILYIRFVDGSKCLGNVEFSELFKKWPQFFKLGIPGALITLGEFLPLEIIFFITSYFGPKAMAAQTALSTINMMVNFSYGSLAVVTTIHVGNNLGRNDPNNAKNAAKLSFLFTLTISIFCGILLYFLKNIVPAAFTKDFYVRKEITSIMTLYIFCQIFSGISGICVGILKGQGRQHISAFFKFTGGYFVAIPVGLFAASVLKLNLFGLWVGIMCCWIYTALGELYFVSKSDWQVQANNSFLRINGRFP